MACCKKPEINISSTPPAKYFLVGRNVDNSLAISNLSRILPFPPKLGFKIPLEGMFQWLGEPPPFFVLHGLRHNDILKRHLPSTSYHEIHYGSPTAHIIYRTSTAVFLFRSKARCNYRFGWNTPTGKEPTIREGKCKKRNSNIPPPPKKSLSGASPDIIGF